MVIDLDLIYKVMNGDGEAFGALVKAHRGDIYAIALSMTGNPTDAEDITQETFIRAYLNISQLESPERFGAWLNRIAQNLCRDWIRKNAQQFLPIDDLFAEEQLTFPAADERMLNEDFGKALASAISSLKPGDRQILKLFYGYGFKYSEIMRVNNIPYSAASSRLHKAKKRLEALIDDYIPPSQVGAGSITLSGGAEYMKLGLSTDFLAGIAAVEHAQLTEIGKRDFLCGINLEYTQEDGLRLIATDGRRLSMAQLPSDGNGESMSATIPTEEINILKEVIGEKSVEVNIERIDADMAAFYIGSEKKLIKLETGSFPDYRGVIKKPENYTDSITIERKPAIDILEKLVGGSSAPSDWIQWNNIIYVSHASDILAMREVTERTVELCYMLLRFISKSTSPEELSDRIFGHLSRDEYQKLLNDLEKRAAPPSEFAGILEVLDSESEVRFVARFNSYFFLDALKAMTCDTVRMIYKKDSHSNTILHPLLLEDETDNIHIFMPMIVD